MPTDIERLQILMEANTKKLSNDLKKTIGLIDNSMNRIERRTDKTTRSMLNSFRGAFATIGSLGVYLSVDNVIRYADSWTLVQNAITSTEKLTGIALKSREQLLELSERSRSDLNATTQLYTRLAKSITNTTDNEEDFARITETVAKALKLGGATASEQASAMLQLSQAFNKGKLDGDEFRAVAENATVIIQGLADHLGVTRQEILKMAGDGKLTVDALVNSLLKISPEVDRAFAQTVPTISDALTRLNDRVTEYVGNLAESKGLADAVRVGITGLANNFELVGDTALVAGAAILGAFGPQAIATVSRFGVALAVSTGGLTAITGGLTAALVALHLFGDSVQPVSGELASLSDYGSATFDVLIDGAGQAATEFKDNLVSAIGVVISGLGGIEVSNKDVLNSFNKLVHGSLQLLLGVANYITETFIATPKVFFETVTALANLMLKGIEAGINAAIAILNKLVDAVNYAGSSVGVEIGKIGEVDLPELKSKFEGAGKRYAEALQRGLQNGFQDGPITKLLNEISDRANQLAGEKENKKVSIAPRLKSPAIRNSNTGQAKQNIFDREVANIKKRIALLQLEQDAVGKSALEAEKSKVAFNLMEAAKNANIPITESLKTKIDTLASGYGAATVKLEQMKSAQEDAAARAVELQTSFQDATSGIVKGLLAGKDAADVFSDSLAQIGDKLLDLALDDVFNSLKGGGGSGSFFGSLFGGISSGGLLGGSIIPGILHSGGVAGSDGYSHGRSFSPSTFAGAPRYHNGGIAGLRPDEVPAILQKGEVVLPRGFSETGSSNSNSTKISVSPVYNIDARGAGENFDEKISEVLSKNNAELEKNFSVMIKNEQNRGRV